MADEPTRPRLAASVLLLREGSGGPEVFVQARTSTMAFAPSVTAFPGGGVDATDHTCEIAWAGPSFDWWAQQLGASDASDARALVVAAVRELFEETGVLLASTARSGPVDAVALERERLDVADHRQGLGALLEQHGWYLRSDLLRPWANWITPPNPGRRYDTFFFAASLPAGLHAELLTTEADEGFWIRPAELLERRLRGAVDLMPPTFALLTELAAAASATHILEIPRTVVPVRPVVISAKGEPLRIAIDGVEFPDGRPHERRPDSRTFAQNQTPTEPEPAESGPDSRRIR